MLAVSGTATEGEISEWATSNNISTDETSEIVSMLISSFAAGTRLAEEIESDMAKETNEMNEIARIVDQNNLGEFDKEKVLDQLDGILNRLDSIRQEVSTLIEAIHKTIINLQENKALPNYTELFHDSMKKFAYNCIMFVWSDFIEIDGSNPYRWETFFKRFEIPIQVLLYDFVSIKFYGRTFDTYDRLKFCIFIDKNHQEQITKLKNLGYSEFADENHDSKIAIGLDLKFYFPCSTIEHIYFLSKYVCFYHLFLLFHDCFEYLKTNLGIGLLEKEATLFENFLPVMTSLFNIKAQKVSNEMTFKYYTYNPVELEILYNKFLLQNVKIIEPKLMKYFLLRCHNNKMD